MRLYILSKDLVRSHANKINSIIINIPLISSIIMVPTPTQLEAKNFKSMLIKH